MLKLNHGRAALALGLLLGCWALELAAAAAYAPDPAHYLSANVAVKAAGFKSLTAAFTGLADGLRALGFTVLPLDPERYHLSLGTFKVGIAAGLDEAQRSAAARAVSFALQAAAEAAITASLAQVAAAHAKAGAGGAARTRVGPTPIVFEFDHLEVFKNHFAAIFSATAVVRHLITDIEARFREQLSRMRGEAGRWITSVDRQFSEFKPHVSLAKFRGSHDLLGLDLTAPTPVAALHISRPEVTVSVQVRAGASA